MRASPVLLVFSDYGGSHKEAKFDVSSFLITSPAGLTDFNARRSRIRAAQLGERRISYKSLGDRVRLQSLGDFLEATDALLGLLVSFAIDKRALHRLTEQAPDSTDERGFGQWASVAFNKLTRVGHLVAMCVEGVRADNQDLVWITDQDDIAPNDAKHADATRLLGHLLSAYCTGPMGHFRFGTTQSDLGDLLIEDLTAVPDLAAGCLNDILTDLHLHPASSSVTRLFAPASPNDKPRTAPLRSWLAGGDEALAKITIAVDEDEHGRCSVRHLTLVSDLHDL
jgi:hypothetical protein